MRPALLALLALILTAPAGAVAQTTGPTGPANPLPPTATTEASVDVSQTAATVRARVNPSGGETRVQFQYGTNDELRTDLGDAGAARRRDHRRCATAARTPHLRHDLPLPGGRHERRGRRTRG